MNTELINYISAAKQAGKSNELIRQELLNVGWLASDVDKVLASSDSSASQLPQPSQDTKPITSGMPLAAPRKEKVKKHFVGLVIFFVVIVSLNFLVGYLGHALSSKNFILGIFVVGLVLTGVFALLSLIIRKIGGRFGKKWSFLSWGVILLLIIGGVWYFYQHSKGYIYRTPGVVYVLDHEVSLEECLSTKDDTVKAACGTNYAVQQKDRSICRKVYGNNDLGYYCEYNYDEYYGTSPTDISECQSMIADSENSLFYKDGCFRSVAITTFNKQVCSYLYREADQKNCVASIDAEQSKKDNVCGPLYVNGKIPANYECDEYVFSQHDLSKCNLLTPAWNKDACVKYVNNYIAAKSQYDSVKQSKPALISTFDSTSNLKNCSYTGVGPGSIYTYSGDCKYYSDQNSLTMKVTNKSNYPLLFSPASVTVFDNTGYVSKACQNGVVKTIDGGNNFSVQVDKGETFIINVACSSGTFGTVTKILIPNKVTGSGQDGGGSLQVDFK
jgi:hypothetical protein